MGFTKLTDAQKEVARQRKAANRLDKYWRNPCSPPERRSQGAHDNSVERITRFRQQLSDSLDEIRRS
jgi:hypothetical protein